MTDLMEAPTDIEPSHRVKAFAKQLLAREMLRGPLGDWYSGVREMAYGGKAGGGKSKAGCLIVAEYAMTFPGVRVGIFRRTLPEGQQTFIPRMRGIITEDIGHYYVDGMEWRLRNGSVIRIGYLRDDDDLQQYYSEDFDALWFDEAVQFDPKHLEFLTTTRLRSAIGAPTFVLYTTNPGGKAHSFLKKRFIDPAEPYVIHHDVLEAYDDDTQRTFTKDVTRVYVPSHVTDNPFITENDPGYIAQLANDPDEIRRRRLYLGDWGINSGSAFKKFSRDTHVIPHEAIPQSWSQWGGLDFGYDPDPLVVLFVAQNPDTRQLVVFNEITLRSTGDQQVKRIIREELGAKPIRKIYADTSGRAKSSQTGKSSWDVFRATPNAIPIDPVQKGPGSRVEGWRIIRMLLEPMLDGDPGLVIMDHCRFTITALEELQFDERRTDDVLPNKEWDHYGDALRYALRDRVYLLPVQEVEVQQPGDFGRKAKRPDPPPMPGEMLRRVS